MVVNPEDFVPYFEWLLQTILWFARTIIPLGVLVIVGCYVATVVRYGPGEAFYIVAKSIASALSDDLPNWSLRRTFAMARLAIQEAIRRRVLLVTFATFALVLLFGGWFLDVRSDHPARVYLGVVLGGTQLLSLSLALLLSTFSLPNDIKNRTIYTVMTKPVRAGEIVMGRILGFSAIGTSLLVVMCVVSCIFVERGLDHDHVIDAAQLEPIPGDGPNAPVRGYKGETSRNAYHRHEVLLDADGNGEALPTVGGHWHNVTRKGEGDSVTYEVGPPQGELRARVPLYGKLRFLDRSGAPGQGLSVGYEWSYRSYIEGGTLGAAIYTFDGITEERFPDGLPLEMTLSVFRTHKGNIEERVRGDIIIKNPNPDARVRETLPIPFQSQEFTVAERFIRFDELQYVMNPNRSQTAAESQEDDFFRDLVDDGKVEIWVRCIDPGQYFGMAQADVYLRPRDASFRLNFAKAYIGLWLQMIVVTCFGVMFSTFLSGAVALMATVATMILGFFSDFVVGIATGAVQGGGPIESTIRVITQYNLMQDLDIGTVPTAVVHVLDFCFLWILRTGAMILPKYGEFSFSAYVSNGFNIYGELLARNVTLTLTYVVLVAVIGYFCLKSREIAA